MISGTAISHPMAANGIESGVITFTPSGKLHSVVTRSLCECPQPHLFPLFSVCPPAPELKGVLPDGAVLKALSPQGSSGSPLRRYGPAQFAAPESKTSACSPSAVEG